MLPEIKQRIEQIRRGEVPEGYRRTKDIGMAPKEWRIGKLSDVLHNEQRPVPKPDKPYWRLGVKSWAKGTFHAYVDDPSTVDMGELYVVKEKDLVVNITFAWEHAIALAKKEDEGLLVSHRFPTYMFDDGNVPEFYQAVFGQPFFKDLLDNISPGGAGRNRVLNRKVFLNLPCYIPPIEEQRKIAEILATCDRVIELKQKLLDELKKLKKVCLEKMFPQKGSSVPEIRFPGFTAPWEQRKFGDLADYKKGPFGSAITKDMFVPKSNGSVKVYEQQNAINKDWCLERYFLPREYASTKLNPFETHGGDIIVSCAGTIGEIYEIPENAEPGVINQALMRVRVNENVVDKKMFIIAFSNMIDSFTRVHSNGSAIKNIPPFSDLKPMEVLMPSLEEQIRISGYFGNLNNLITLHQRELEAEQQKRKALMQLLLTGLMRTV